MGRAVTDTTQLRRRFQRLRDVVSQATGSKKVLSDLAEAARVSAQKSRDEIERTEQAAEVIQIALETRRTQIKDRVENLVTHGLRAVFGRDDMEFFLRAWTGGGVGQAGMIPTIRSKFRGKLLEADIVKAHGGGVADVVSFVLRVITLCLARPRLAPFLVLDEPFRHVSPEYLRGCSDLMRELNQSVGIQFLLITHKAELLDFADVIYSTSIADGLTTLKLEHDLRDDAYHGALQGKARERSNEWDQDALATPDLGEAAPVSDSVDTDGLARKQLRRRRGRLTEGWTAREKRLREKRRRDGTDEDPEDEAD